MDRDELAGKVAANRDAAKVLSHMHHNMTIGFQFPHNQYVTEKEVEHFIREISAIIRRLSNREQALFNKLLKMPLPTEERT